MAEIKKGEAKLNIRGILFLTLGGMAAQAVLILTGAEGHKTVMGTLMTLYFAAAAVLLAGAFRDQAGYDPYSYDLIYYAAFSLFSLVLAGISARMTWLFISGPEIYAAAGILYSLAGAQWTFLFLSFPFLTVFSLGLCVSNTVLLKREGRSFVNTLGLLLAFCLMGGFFFLYRINMYMSGSMYEVMAREAATNLLALVYFYVECMLLGVMAANIYAVRHEPEPDRDFLIVLGCAVRRDGTPTPLLRARLDRALAFREKQMSLTGKDPVFVASGGQGADEVISESECMKRYLLSRGISEERILMEDKSVSTFENMKFSREKILEAEPDGKGKTAFSTSGYHVFRSGILAGQAGLRARGMGAGTRWYFWPNAAVREFIGILTEHRRQQAFIFICMALISLTLTILRYYV